MKLTERLVENKFFVDKIRRELKMRQPGNIPLHELIDNLSDQTIVAQYLEHHERQLQTTPKSEVKTREQQLMERAIRGLKKRK